MSWTKVQEEEAMELIVEADLRDLTPAELRRTRELVVIENPYAHILPDSDLVEAISICVGARIMLRHVLGPQATDPPVDVQT